LAVPTPTPTPTPVTPVTPVAPPPPPCYNNNNWCNGNGACNQTTGYCNCIPSFGGHFCNQSITVFVQRTCNDIGAPTCSLCQEYSSSINLPCVWCSNGTNITTINNSGTCSSTNQCPHNNSYFACPFVTNYIPEVCPDQCTGHGTCVNYTSPDYAAAKLAAGTDYAKNASAYCFCQQGYYGINCGQIPVTTTSVTTIVASAIGGAALAGIIVAGVVVFLGVGGGTVYAVAGAGGGGAAPVTANNPLYKDCAQGGANPLHQV